MRSMSLLALHKDRKLRGANGEFLGMMTVMFTHRSIPEGERKGGRAKEWVRTVIGDAFRGGRDRFGRKRAKVANERTSDLSGPAFRTLWEESEGLARSHVQGSKTNLRANAISVAATLTLMIARLWG